ATRSQRESRGSKVKDRRSRIAPSICRFRGKVFPAFVPEGQRILAGVDTDGFLHRLISAAPPAQNTYSSNATSSILDLPSSTLDLRSPTHDPRDCSSGKGVRSGRWRSYG